MYSETLLDEIKLITGIDLNEFLSTFVSFMDYDYIEIANYYSGISKIPNGESFKNLNNLLDNSKFFINLLNLNKEKFFTIEIWEVLIILEEINNKLLFTNNISKFLRSSIIKGQFNLGVINYLSLNYQENLEKVAKKLNSVNPDNDWVDIAIKNDLIEEDYTNEGGEILKVVYNNNFEMINMLSVVDNIEGEKMYGLDLDKIITFENNDLKVLSYKETILQTIEIKLNLKQGDVPEFPKDGIQLNQAVGSNLAAIQFPILFRQLSSLFSKDDSISSLSIKDINVDGDAVFVVIEINTRYNEQFQKQIPII